MNVKAKRKKKNKSRFKKTCRVTAVVLIAVAASLCVLRLVPDSGQRQLSVEGCSNVYCVALTFDDGPGEYTDTLLYGLNKYGAKASFFVIGKHVEQYPETIKKMYSDGHLIGNHSYSHIKMLSSTVKEIKNDTGKCDAAVEKITGEKPQLFRAPHGHTTAYQLKTLGMYFVKWSYDTYDWKHEDADYVYEEIMKSVKDGAIILMHDTKRTTVEGALRAVKELSEKGVTFVRVDELLARNGEAIKSGVAYRGCRYNKSQVWF